MAVRLLSLLTLLLTLPTARATPIVGAEWSPLSRGDLVAVDEEQTSGTLVGEFDGWVQPSLRFYGGCVKGIWTTTGGLRFARVTNTQWSESGGVSNQTHVGALRPSIDIRRTLNGPSSSPRTAWIETGLWGVLPSARLSAASYSAAEQDDANQEAAELRARIGGAGLRAGVGASVDVGRGISLGARSGGLIYLGQSLTEGSLTTSIAVWTETTLIAEMRM